MSAGESVAPTGGRVLAMVEDVMDPGTVAMGADRIVGVTPGSDAPGHARRRWSFVEAGNVLRKREAGDEESGKRRLLRLFIRGEETSLDNRQEELYRRYRE